MLKTQYILNSLLLAISLRHFTGTKAVSRPHIVMIVADDLGWDDVSFHGSSQIPTPNIDVLANSGVILNSHYVSPICTPTRASFMTGKHPVNLGMQHGTIFGTQPYGLPLGETTTPQYLKSLGYTTRGVGKWHLGFFEKEYTPTFRGFDSFYGYWTGKTDYWTHQSYEDYWGLDLRDNMQPVNNMSGHYNTELFTEVAQKIIAGHDSSTPLFLYIAHHAVHSGNIQDPLQAPKRIIDKFTHFSSNERRTYAAMVASLDVSVGNITKALKTKGMYDNSVIVFTTDNGGAPAGFDGSQGCNYPFKGGKDTLWEGGVRGVAFAHSPMIEKKGRVSNDLIDATDWLPTFYHLAGGDVTKIQHKIDGKNVWDTIAQGAQSPRSEVLHNIDPIRKFAAIRVDQYKLVVNQDSVFRTTWHPRYAVVGEPGTISQADTLPGAVVDCGLQNTYQTMDCDTDVFPCLFDISKDPCEYQNIAHANLGIVRKLLYRIFEYHRRALPVWYPQRDPLADPALQGGSWGPWKSITVDNGMTLGHNDKEKTASYMGNEINPNANSGSVNDSQSLYCCHKYNLNYSNLIKIQSDRDEKIYSMLKNIILTSDTNTTEHNNSSRLPVTFPAKKGDCCQSNTTIGQLNDSQIEECCLRSGILTFGDVVSIQTAKDKQVFDVLHKLLNISEVMKRDIIKGNKRTMLQDHPNKMHQWKRANINS